MFGRIAPRADSEGDIDASRFMGGSLWPPVATLLLRLCILMSGPVLSACGAEGDDAASPEGELYDTDDAGDVPHRITFSRQMERLGRGVASFRLPSDDGNYTSWRLLGDDPVGIAFNIYRYRGDGAPERLNTDPILLTTDYVDPAGAATDSYSVAAIVDGVEAPVSAPAFVSDRFRRIRLRGDYDAAKVAVGDLDGDGELDYVIKQPNWSTDPGVQFTPPEDTYKIEAYSGDGDFLWQRDLGWNIVMGEWWSPLLVYDLDGDGLAEVVTKTAPTDEDFRNADGRVLEGDEWLSVLDGLTGEERARDNWIPRGNAADWGDSYGNRVNRNKLAVAYLDGERPSLIVFRGIYGLMKAEAWNFRDGGLTRLWRWTNPDGGGFRDVQVGDLDGDGLDEIVNGSMAIDHDGRDLWNTGEGGGDRSILADIDVNRPGLEVWYSQDGPYQHPYHLRDAATGALIWGDPWWDLWDDPAYRKDNGRSVVADLDPASPGQEAWCRVGGLFNAVGEWIGATPTSNAYTVYWDGDLLREVVEAGVIGKYDPVGGLTETIGTGVEVAWSERLVGDLFGDWREEIVYVVNGELRVYATPYPAESRLITLIHDSMYRTGIAMSGSGWFPNGHTSFFLGAGMAPPPPPKLFFAPR